MAGIIGVDDWRCMSLKLECTVTVAVMMMVLFCFGDVFRKLLISWNKRFEQAISDLLIEGGAKYLVVLIGICRYIIP